MIASNPKRVITHEIKNTEKQRCTIPKKPKISNTVSQEPKPKGSRSAIEKHRRQQMKDLYSRLASVIPPLTTKKLPLPALLDRSFGYVKELKEGVEELKARRDRLREDLAMAAVNVNEYESDSILEVSLVTGLNKGYILPEILKVLEQEGARVMTANYSRLSDRILYSITSQAFSPRIGIATSRVHERLKIIAGISFVSPNSMDSEFHV